MGLFLLSWKQQVYSHEKLYQNAEEAWTQSGSAKEKMMKNLTFSQTVLWFKRSDDETEVVCFRPPSEAEECYASHYLYNGSYNVNSVSPEPVCANQLCF